MNNLKAITFNELIDHGVAEIVKIDSGEKIAYRTSIKAIDSTVPIYPGTINFCCSRPGMGKTRLLLKMLTGFIGNGKKVAMFSGEDNKENVGIRVLSTFTGMSTKGLYLDRNGVTKYNVDPYIFKAHDIKEKYGKNCLFFFTQNSTIDELIKKFDQLKDKGCNVILYDYVQTIKTCEKMSLYDRHNYIAETLRDYFTSSSMAFIGILQLNRSADTDKSFGSLSQLFGSSSYEMIAHSITIIQREKLKDMSNPTGFKYTNNTAVCVMKNRLPGVLANYLLDENLELIN